MIHLTSLLYMLHPEKSSPSELEKRMLRVAEIIRKFNELQLFYEQEKSTEVSLLLIERNKDSQILPLLTPEVVKVFKSFFPTDLHRRSVLLSGLAAQILERCQTLPILTIEPSLDEMYHPAHIPSTAETFYRFFLYADHDFLRWITANKLFSKPEDRLLSALKNANSRPVTNLDEFEVFFTHPNRLKIMSKVPAVWYQRLINANSLTNKWEHTLFTLQYPEFVETAYELEQKQQDPSELSWGERFKLLHKFGEKLGTHSVSDDELNESILSIWKQQTGGYVKLDNMRGYYDDLPVKDQKMLLARLRNGTPLKSVNVLRRKIREQKNPEEEAAKLAEKIKRISIIESPYHPLNHLLPRQGFETEALFASGMVDWTYSVLEKAGYHRGKDRQIEFAPGPFHRAETAEAVFESLVNLGFLDLNSEQGQTVHYSVQVQSCALGVISGRLLEGDGLSYLPLFKVGDGYDVAPIEDSENIIARYTQEYLNSQPRMGLDNPVEMRVYPNEKNTGPFIQFKEYALVCKHGFQNNLLRYGESIFTSQKNYEAVIKNVYKLPDAELKEYMAEKPEAFKLTPEQIDRSTATVDQKRLAHIYMQTWHEYKAGLKQVGLNNFLQHFCPSPSASRFGRLIYKVFPSIWDRHDEGRLHTSFLDQQIESSGKVFPNIAAFHLYLKQKNYQQVWQVLNSAEASSIAQLKTIAELPLGPKRNSAIKRYFRRFFPDNYAWMEVNYQGNRDWMNHQMQLFGIQDKTKIRF